MVKLFSVQVRKGSTAFLEQSAFLLLVVLALVFGFERVQTPLRLGDFLTMTNVELVLYLTLLAWAFACLAARRRPRTPPALIAPVLVWLGVLLLSALLAPSHRANALKFFTRVVRGVLIGWAVYDMSYTAARGRLLTQALALAGIVIALFGLGEAANAPLITAWLAGFKDAPTRVGDMLRVSSTLIYATITSMVLEMAAPLVLGWLWVTRRIGFRLLLGGALVVTLAAQTLTLTRSGMLSLTAAFGFVALVGLRRHNRRVVAGGLLGLGLLGALVGLVFVNNPLTRLRLASETEALWYQAQYQAPASLAARPGAMVTASVQITNTGVRLWNHTAPNPFHLSYHLARSDGTSITYDSLRTALPQDVPPGETVQVTAQVQAPPEEGEYVVEWDLVQEGVTWFSWKGAPGARTRLHVSGPPAAAVEIAPSAPPTDVRLQAPTPGRLTLWRTALRMFLARPLWGVGPDNFRWVYGDYAGLTRWDVGIHANNLYLEWLADTGLPGLLAFLWLSWRLTRQAWPRLRALPLSPSPSQGKEAVSQEAQGSALWQLALGSSLLTWYVHGLFDYFYEFTPTYVLFWMVAGLAVSEWD